MQATNINNTTQKNIRDSIEIAASINTETQEVVDGRVVSKKQGLIGFELILTAKKILMRKLANRVSSISNTETQVPAERAKEVEAQVLTFGGRVDRQAETQVTKIWVTQGDSRVRDSHLDADGQERKMNRPFDVGGFQLRVPGDSTLGAPLDETINCRCAAVYNEKQVIAIRFDRERNEPVLARG